MKTKAIFVQDSLVPPITMGGVTSRLVKASHIALALALLVPERAL